MSTQQPKLVNGSQYCAAFAQLLGLCAEGRSVFLCNAAAGRLNNGSPSCQQMYDVTSAEGTIMYTDQSARKLGRVMDGTGT